MVQIIIWDYIKSSLTTVEMESFLQFEGISFFHATQYQEILHLESVVKFPVISSKSDT